MSCKDKILYTCGTRLNARCVDYEGIISECSELGTCDKYRLHDVIEDTQSILTRHCNFLDVSDVDPECADLSAEPSLSGYLNDLYAKVCSMGAQIPNTLCDMDITCLNLDYKCLLDDPCNEGKPSNPSELFQLLIDQICEIKDSLLESMG